MEFNNLSKEDRLNLEKFTKHFVIGCVQVIVQSRLGEKVAMSSKPFSLSADWFNIAINYIPEITVEARKASSGISSLSPGHTVLVEISLKSCCGDSLILEIWSVTMLRPHDPNSRILFSVYNRMSTAIRSLFAVSRALPSYQLSRRQSSESYVLCYRIYSSVKEDSVEDRSKKFLCLGEGPREAQVGAVATPAGSLMVAVAYRTRMSFSPRVLPVSVVDLCENYFTTAVCQKSCNDSTGSPMVVQNGEYLALSNECGDELAEPAATINSPCKESLRETKSRRKPKVSWDNNVIQRSYDTDIDLLKPLRQAAFAPASQIESENSTRDHNDNNNFWTLFEPLLSEPAVLEVAGNEDERSRSRLDSNANEEKLGSESEMTAPKSASSQTEDFIMVELKAAFAPADCNSSLGLFYRECQLAPALSMSEYEMPVAEILDCVSEQLDFFQISCVEFDSFVDALNVESLNI